MSSDAQQRSALKVGLVTEHSRAPGKFWNVRGEGILSTVLLTTGFEVSTLAEEGMLACT